MLDIEHQDLAKYTTLRRFNDLTLALWCSGANVMTC